MTFYESIDLCQSRISAEIDRSLNGLSHPVWERSGSAICGSPPLRPAACPAGSRLLNCFSTSDVVYDAAMTSSLIARLSKPLAQGYGMTPDRRMAGTSLALAAPVDRARLRVEAE
jgi:hypothetical protein